MRDTGLTKAQLRILEKVFARHPQIDQVKIYGSRAKGNYHPRSDIDLAAYGDALNRSVIADVLLDLDDSDIPYQVDLHDYHDLKNKSLTEHIDRVGFAVYQRASQ